MFDRAGGVGRNFFGIGLNVELPLFGRNQGGIRAAHIGIQQSQILVEHKLLEIRNEIIEAMQNFTLAYNFNREISDEFISDLDEMLESYTEHFRNRNIGILDFLDFFEAYKDNKHTILEAQKELKTSFEELQYAVGAEL
jgi:cobalt-zinc-cadmium efflux system outer membrane protein